MKECLDLFCQASGQNLNFDKSAIFCSPNVSRALAQEISFICGSPLIDNLGKYLGMPVLHYRVTRSTYSSLLSKVHCRLANWKMDGGGEVRPTGAMQLWLPLPLVVTATTIFILFERRREDQLVVIMTAVGYRGRLVVVAQLRHLPSLVEVATSSFPLVCVSSWLMDRDLCYNSAAR
ncbi:Hypothetical predicted protein [Prunus dulcis]|uniref:Uncharacterized protein n=1 Tax=Prunus dulcis TaxID=3755 RepID=A0A5E4FIQ7_PRUDU|nr:hypothetical protein L3X38_005455 [Prunus dulcis]VVA27712.1 Hypothetical predicted protein [Prunus dulcis]